MPASAGRTRMPHNNRMSIDSSLRTTSIWSKTIGHDPYAGRDESTTQEEDAKLQDGQKKREAVLAVARQQNLTDGANRDDFALKMYQGLKAKKKSATDEQNAQQSKGMSKLQDDPLSSSEDEFVAVPVKEKKKSKHKKRKHKKKHYSSSEDSDSSDDGRRTKKRKREKRSKRKYSDDDSDSEDSTSRHRRRRHRKRNKRKRKRKKYSSSSSYDSDSSCDSTVNTADKKRSNGRKIVHKKGQEGLPFIASESYTDSRKGYVFKMGEQGLGYYLDHPPKVNSEKLMAMLQLYQDT